ncbi:COP1-interacting protein 7 isoform X3 [Rhododendron vialii]|uniref:COP1-interacting protein 7 isoform X3 n=1 Tax=Rhododendron vialii TaxID=182163 RepID=UPI00265F0574|nr:COP1-interacting protein 7 isoform X3 [Rhododendron vialii]
MDPRTRLDNALFQLTPTRTRCDLVIFAGGSSEKLASGLLEPFLSHLNYARDQIRKGGYSVTLQPPLAYCPWFTKATLQRFVRFVNSPEVLERFVTIEREISQIESSIQSNERAAVTSETEAGNVSVVDDYTKKSTASSKEESSKVRLQRVLETRRVVLGKEQAMAYARALVAGFEVDCINDLISFADAFGASRLREACIKFMELCKKKNDDRLWMDELAAMQAYSHSEFPYLANSGIVLAGEDNDHSQGIVMNVNNIGLSSDSTLSHESLDTHQDKSLPRSAPVQSTDGKPQVPMSWLNHVPPYMHNFPGHLFQQMTPYQGYPFPGMQVPPPYYPGNMQWPPNMEGSSLGLDQEPRDHRHRQSYSRKKEKSSHVKRSQNTEQDDNTEPSDSNSVSDSSVEQIDRKRHAKRSSRKVVIRNINYITSKGDGGKGSASEDNSFDENELKEEDSFKHQVEEAVGSLERQRKSNSHSKKKRNGIRHHSIVNGSNNAGEQDNENLNANVSKGDKRTENWDIFQNLLMRETDSRSNDTIESSREGIAFELNVDSEKVTKPHASTDSFIVTDMGRSNERKIHAESFEVSDTVRPISKTRNSTYEEELLYSQGTEKSKSHSRAILSDFGTESSVIKSQKGEDWFPGNQPDNSATLYQGAHQNKFDGDYINLRVVDQSQIEKNKKDVLVDDSFMVQARPMDNDQLDSQPKMDLYLVSDIAGATQQSISFPNNSQEKVETAGISEPDDLCMVLGRNSDGQQVVVSWNPEIDYGNINSLAESVERLPKGEPANGVDVAKESSSSKGTKSKANRAPGGKASSKEATAKTSVGSLGRSRSEIISRSTKQTSSGSRTVSQKSKSEKEEEKRKIMEELRIERQKRIAERSAASGHNPATTKRTSKGNKTEVISMKNEKPKLQSPEKEMEKLQKPVLKTSTIDRLASAKVTHKLPSTELKSSQPRKAISKAYGTENKKLGTEKVKHLDKKESPSKSNGSLSAASVAHSKTDGDNLILALPATELATQPSDAIDGSKNIEQVRRMSSIEENGDKDLPSESLEDKIYRTNSPKGNFSMPIQDHSAQLDYVKGDNHSTASNGRAQFSPEVTVHFFPSSPKKALSTATLPIGKNNVAKEQFDISPGLTVIQVATPPPEDEMTTLNHSRKKWNSGEHSPKAMKGFKKLLFFGRKNFS